MVELMESPAKTDGGCESRGIGFHGNEHLLGGGTDDVSMTTMSRRALSYSIDNLLATTSSARLDSDIGSAAADALRRHSISQQRELPIIHSTIIVNIVIIITSIIPP